MSDLLYTKLSKKDEAIMLLNNYKINYSSGDDAKKIDYLISNLKKDQFNEKNYEEVSLNDSKNKDFFEVNNNLENSNNYDDNEY